MGLRCHRTDSKGVPGFGLELVRKRGPKRKDAAHVDVRTSPHGHDFAVAHAQIMIEAIGPPEDLGPTPAGHAAGHTSCEVGGHEGIVVGILAEPLEPAKQQSETVSSGRNGRNGQKQG